MGKVKYRLDVDYLSREYEDRMCETSSPIYTLEDGIAKYQTAITKKCIDDHAITARVHLWKYHYTNGEFDPITIAKNYSIHTLHTEGDLLAIVTRAEGRKDDVHRKN